MNELIIRIILYEDKYTINKNKTEKITKKKFRGIYHE